MPIDVVKVRLQYQGADGVKLYRGLTDAFTKTLKAEGPAALYKGLSPALVRQVMRPNNVKDRIGTEE
jgi:hypothetical protein